MKKYTFHHISIASLGIPFLILGPGVHGQEQDKSDNAAEVVETEQTEQTEQKKGEARSVKEADKRAKELAEETAGRAEDASVRAEEAAENSKDAEKVAETEQTEQSKVKARIAKDAPKRAKERAKVAAGREKETAELAKEAADEKKQLTGPIQDEGKSPAPEKTPDESAERVIEEIPASEPELQAETEVAEVTRELRRDLDKRKTRIESPEEARAVIDDILGAESRISRAEIAREQQFRPRFERQRPGEERFIEVSPEQRRDATTYFQQRLRGREIEGPPPEFFGRSQHRRDRRDGRVDERDFQRVEFVRPRYLNEGRRYVHYDSRASVPAILMAARAMNHVRFQPTREIAPMLYGRQEVSASQAMPLPPESYRGQDSVVVSYPVDENSMISSEDILFRQGSTQFSDPYSYEVVGIMADAMKAMPEQERFVIEGHASAEGDYDSNMALSQQRAELIVREIVRQGGVSPYRLLPVGYGESEARHPADAAEYLRSQDRRVVVFRMKPETIARR